MNSLATAVTVAAPAPLDIPTFAISSGRQLVAFGTYLQRGHRTGPLHDLAGGDGDRAAVSLHGLVSSGDVLGAAYDQLVTTHRVVGPDLLGFGRSMDQTRTA